MATTIDGAGGLNAGGTSAVNKYYTPLSQKQGLVGNIWSGTGQLGGDALLNAYNSGMSDVEIQSMYNNMNSDGVFDSNGLSGLASGGSGGFDWGAAGGMAMDGLSTYLSYDQNKKNYELQKKALNDQLANSEMTRQTTGLAGVNNANTKLAFANATGQDTTDLEKNKAIFEGYAGTASV